MSGIHHNLRYPGNSPQPFIQLKLDVPSSSKAKSLPLPSVPSREEFDVKTGIAPSRVKKAPPFKVFPREVETEFHQAVRVRETRLAHRIVLAEIPSTHSLELSSCSSSNFVTQVSPSSFYKIEGILQFLEEDRILPKNEKKNLIAGLRSTSKYLEKSEVLSKIRARIDFLNEKLLKKPKPENSEEMRIEILDALELIRYVQTSGPLPFISVETFQDLLSKFRIFLRGIAIYFSDENFLSQLGDLTHISEKLRSFLNLLFNENGIRKQFFDPPSQAFKLGSENFRELLAGKSAQILGLNKVLLPKHLVRLPNTVFERQSNPTGLASKWIESDDQRTESFKMAWHQYLQVKRKIAIDHYKGVDTTAEEEELKKLDGVIRSFCPDEQMQMHVMLDLLYNSCDSHLLQYVQSQEEQILYNIDFSRIFYPSEVLASGDDFFPNLRSTFLDHPSTQTPLAPNLVKTIQSWDVDTIIHTHTKMGLVGSKELYESALKELEGCKKDQEVLEKRWDEEDEFFSYNTPELNDPNFNDYSEDFKVLCRRYCFTPDEGETVKVSVPKLQEKMKSFRKAIEKDFEMRREAILKPCMERIHPMALDRFVGRIRAAKGYIKECSAKQIPPTVRGLRDVCYPYFAPFFTVLERMDSNPGQAIHVHKVGGTLIPRTLNGIMQKAKDLKLASPKEIEEMEKAIEQLRNDKIGFDPILIHFITQ